VKEIIRTYYQCDYCKKKYRYLECGQIHETEECLKNPSLKSCLTCKHFEIIKTNYCDLSEIKESYCNKLNSRLKAFSKNCKNWKNDKRKLIF